MHEGSVDDRFGEQTRRGRSTKCGGVVEPNKSPTHFRIESQERGDDLCVNRSVQLCIGLEALSKSSYKARHAVNLRLQNCSELLRHLAAQNMTTFRCVPHDIAQMVHPSDDFDILFPSQRLEAYQ